MGEFKKEKKYFVFKMSKMTEFEISAIEAFIKSTTFASFNFVFNSAIVFYTYLRRILSIVLPFASSSINLSR